MKLDKKRSSLNEGLSTKKGKMFLSGNASVFIFTKKIDIQRKMLVLQ